MNYDALIKRAKKAIHNATMKVLPASVHIVTIDDNTEELPGLVVVLHPDYVKLKNDTKDTHKITI